MVIIMVMIIMIINYILVEIMLLSLRAYMDGTYMPFQRVSEPG